ncbi:NAD(P)/FAD-dependent oxidoreductase [Sphingobium estronivorans]|uniref:NAD(P)/FAD-dependent oxidoreductase n=1 Tax=Sphingobium estronivorans TaxID=1577690 RepID=UPI0013C327FE|nr:FAD-dependent oxidoreductase [Sphingobium estronivorans]
MNERIATDVLVIGGGHAGAHLAISLRQKGFSGTITVVSDEPTLPYDRPPLSKAYLIGNMQIDRLLLRDNAYWTEQQVHFELGCRVSVLDTAHKQVELEDGRAIAFQWCVLATGGKVRSLVCPGSELGGIHYLRTVADVDAIRHGLENGGRLGIIGAGYVGLEVAAAAREMGHDVAVIEAQDRVLQRVTSPIVSDFFERQHRARGVALHLGAQVAAFVGEGRVSAVRLASGEDIPVDLAIVGIGIDAEATLAEKAGIACDSGVLVDEYCRTSAEAVLAIGDCARHPNDFAGGLWRLESVQHAMDSAAIAADTIMDAPTEYRALPTFWSDQFDLKLQSAGLNKDADEIIVRGDSQDGPFAALYLKEGRIISIDAINSPKDFMGARSLIIKGAMPDRTQLADMSIALKKVDCREALRAT